MSKCKYVVLALAVMLVGSVRQAKAESFGIETLQLQYVEQGWGQPHANRSVDRHPLTLDGKRFEHGLGTHANSTFRIALGGEGSASPPPSGVDDEVGKRAASCSRSPATARVLWESGVLRGGDAGQGSLGRL